MAVICPWLQIVTTLLLLFNTLYQKLNTCTPFGDHGSMQYFTEEVK